MTISLLRAGAANALTPTASTQAAGEPRILIIEDEPEIAEEIRRELDSWSYSTRITHTVDDGLNLARSGWATLLIVDRMLDEADGLSIVETLRSEGNTTPVLLISALGSIDERINGLRAGGDDYLIKPFDTRELGARVEALLRRVVNLRSTQLKVGTLEMDLVDRKVSCAERLIDLLPKEFKLLEYFMLRAGQVVTRAMLLEDVWNYKFMAPTNVVDVQISNLRRKLDPTGQRKFIVNVRAVGFKLDADA